MRPLLRMVGLTAVALLVPLSTSAASAGQPPNDNQYPGHAYNCTAGDVPAGTYNSITISGICYMPAGSIVVRGDLNVAPGALLDAVTPGDPTTGTPVVPATVVVGGNVFVGSGGVLLFGCSPNISCSNPPGISYDRIRGNLIANGAEGVVVHSASIGGSVIVSGGGGGSAAEGCTNGPAPTPLAPAPWSEDPALGAPPFPTPVYTDFEDNSIGGSLSIAGLTSCWLGSLRNEVGRNATFANNTLGDPDGSEIVNNLVNGNMACSGNSPAVQWGDTGGAPNIVGGYASGECAFNVVQPNPAPEAGQGPGTPEHISVSTWSLKSYRGAHTATNVTSLPNVTLSSGNTVAAQLNNFALTGKGLTGTGTLNQSLPPGSTGEVVLATVSPNGTESFTAYDTCDSCSFDGQSGATSIRAYGTTYANGFTTGTFLITSGGPVVVGPAGPGPSTGGLATLAGYGSFFGSGSTLTVIEHLRIT
jgi:hypothetical protein